MLGDSSVFGAGSSADAGPASASAAAAFGSHESGGESSAADAAGGRGSNSGDDGRAGRGEEFGERSFGGNRWPRQETLALLKIRSDMNVAFRDASVKGPLWEEVSRKLAELGYNRSAKKCKEKFENVYKYHKRTKEGRTGKGDGKTYRFFNQLEALDSNPLMHSVSPSKPQTATPAVTMAMTMALQQANTTSVVPCDVAHGTVPSTRAIANPNLSFSSFPPVHQANPTVSLPPSTANPTGVPASLFQSIPTDLLSNSTSSSSTSSAEEVQGQRNKRKRKWKDVFERLMKEVIDKQEDMQLRFLEAIEKREHGRMVREEAWRAQEIARINREREILAHERSMAAAKDAVVMSFLQKIADQQNLGQAFSNINFQVQPQPPPTQPSIQVQQSTPPVSPPLPPQLQQSLPPQVPSSIPQQQQVTTGIVSNIEFPNRGQNFLPASSSRWPKVEVQALIELRTSLDTKYQDSGSKGPLWEEISASMRKLDYNRSAKRCKEKWENINKYYKKVKESNKKRPEDSKTCPYFHILDAIYKEKNKFEKPETVMGSIGAPLMVTPEQQWPPQQDTRPGTGSAGPGLDVTMEDLESEPDEEEEKNGDDEDEGGSSFEIVPSKPSR